jgi:hypothetical protein
VIAYTRPRLTQPRLLTLLKIRWLQVVDEIRDAPEFVTLVEFRQHEQRLLANAAASEERVNGRFQQAFTELPVTLSSTIITQLAAPKQVNI